MRLAKLSLLLGMSAWLSLPTHAAGTPNNIRIVTFQTMAAANMMVNLDVLKDGYSLCRKARGLSQGVFPTGLTEETIRKHTGTRVWKYFSGKAQAEFTEMGIFFVDPNTCRVYQESTYHANVQLDCEISWAGSGSKDVAPQVISPLSGTEACFKSAHPESDQQSLASMKETKVNGVPCRFIPDGGPVERVKFCNYAKTPFYMGNIGRPVTFEEGKDMTGPTPSQAIELEQFQDGDFTFAPQQFTKQAVLDWIRRPPLKEYK